MKRFISGLLLFCVIITSSGFMTACSAKKASEVTVGEWLMMVNQMFGMETYTEENPFFESIDKENKYFGTVQIAAEWGVVDVDKDLDVDKKLTYEEALLTLVNVGSFLDEDADDDSKIAYAIENFDNSIKKYWLNRNIEATKAVKMLACAHEKWANKTYKEPISEIKLQNNVIDCTKGDTFIGAYEIDENGDILIPVTENPKIELGKVFILPSNGQVAGGSTYKAASITVENEKVRVSVTEADISEVVEEIKVAETVVPTSENIMIYDGNGNIIYVGDDIAVATNTAQDSEVRNVGYLNVASAGVTTTFEFEKFKIELKYNFNDGFNLETKVVGELHEFKNGAKLELEESVAIEDLMITTDYDFGIIKGLKSASVRVNYDKKEELALSLSKDVVDKVVAPKYSNGNGKFLTNLKKSVLKDSDAPGAKTIKIGSFTIADAALGRICLDIKLKISVEGKISIVVEESGVKGIEYKAGNIRTIFESNRETNFELEGKSEATVGIGPAIYAIGLKKSIVGASINVGVGAKGGVSVHLADSEMHLIETMDASSLLPNKTKSLVNTKVTADSSAIEEVAKSQGVEYKIEGEGEINLDIHACLDIRVYGILNIAIETSYLKDILDINKVKVKFTIFDDKNAMFARIHKDDFETTNVKFGASANEEMCSFKFANFDSESEDTGQIIETEISNSQVDGTNSENSESQNGNGEFLLLSEMKKILNVGESYVIPISSIPNGYSEKDLVVTIEDKEIVVEEGGCKIKANAIGSTIVTVSTKDGKFCAYISVTVTGKGSIV